MPPLSRVFFPSSPSPPPELPANLSFFLSESDRKKRRRKKSQSAEENWRKRDKEKSGSFSIFNFLVCYVVIHSWIIGTVSKDKIEINKNTIPYSRYFIS